MKVYIEPASDDQGMGRVNNALIQYAPGHIKIVSVEADADLVVLHVADYEELLPTLEFLKEHERAYAIMQYGLRETVRPLTRSWLPIWRDAVCVWSYYDLIALAEEDHDDRFVWADEKVNFYHAPLGAEPDVFKPCGINGRSNLILTGGYPAHTKGVAEASVATELMGGIQLHVGPEMYLGPHVLCAEGLSDVDLAEQYSRSKFVAGLRRTEGFELPTVEGLLCGARPIMFDVPHYRQWFDEFAEFIPKGTFDEVVESLHQVFLKGATPVSREERDFAVERFNWEKLVNEFWQTI